MEVPEVLVVENIVLVALAEGLAEGLAEDLAEDLAVHLVEDLVEDLAEDLVEGLVRNPLPLMLLVGSTSSKRPEDAHGGRLSGSYHFESRC